MKRGLVTTCALPLLFAGVLHAAPAPTRIDDAVLRALGDVRIVKHGVMSDGGRTIVVRGNLPKLGTAEREDLLERLMGALSALDDDGHSNVSGGVQVLVQRDDGVLEPLVPAREAPPPPQTGRAPRTPAGKSTTSRLPLGGALVGKRIALSAGHGWLTNGSGGWNTQRDRLDFVGCAECRGIVEDFYTADTMTRELIPLLQSMGAEVVLVRDPDHDVHDPVVVDENDPGYTESGAWSDGSSAGGFGSGYRVNPDSDNGSVTYTFSPQAGPRRVAVRFVEGSNRTHSAVFSISQGDASPNFTHTILVDQTQMGRFWHDLGSYDFESGGSLVISHAPAAGFLIADATRVGGGMFVDVAGVPSGKPSWQMGAKSYVPFAGTDPTIAARNDVTIRPGYSEFVGADAYVALHSNASGVTGGSSARGLSVYRYSCQSFPDHSSSDSATSCDQPTGSQDLLDLVDASILQDVRTHYDATYADRGKLVANFGELRELSTMPGILVESAFHDNLSPAGDATRSDNQMLHDPRYREALTRGIARGLAQFFTPGSDVPPARPDGVQARNQPDGTLVVRFPAVPGAVQYRIEKARLDDATSGRLWDEGDVVTSPSKSYSAHDLLPGAVYAFRVRALSGNGAGLASQAVAARFRGTSSSTPVAALLVDAYDRRDAWVQEEDNSFDNAVEHGRALARAYDGKLVFDGVLDEVIDGGDVPLGAYRVVDLFCGKDSVEHDAVSKSLQASLRSYVQAGGKVLLSGEEIGYALVGAGNDDGTGAAFLRDVFHAQFVADNAGTHAIAPVSGSIFDDVTVHLDDGSEGTYRVVYPDVFAATDGGSIGMAYGSVGGACIVSDNTVLCGAPIEAMVPEAGRDALVQDALLHLLPSLPGDDVTSGEGEGEGEGDVGEGEGEGETRVVIPPSSLKKGGCACAQSTDSAPLWAGVVVLAAWRRRRHRARGLRAM